jgi:tetratricopeptide (TPR) repeat protein
MQRDLEADAERPIGGRFWIEELLGRSWTGSIYQVRDAQTGDRLALKGVQIRHSDEGRRQRALLEREFHMLAQLARPELIDVYAVGADDKAAYYTMELLAGGLAPGKLAWREACAVLIDVASSLCVLHARGLLHGGVSRDNVRSAAGGRFKLMDFGVVRCIGSRPPPSGQPPFVAPEVLFLQALDVRADLFALGALAYSLLTGRHAFEARDLEGLRDAWRSSVVVPSRFASDVPEALDRWVLRLLSLDRGSRPSCAADALQQLNAILGVAGGERPDLARGFLALPRMVGRDPVLTETRKHVLALLGGAGGTVLIEGEPGTGRSRVLDACVFEGKLLGATVLRISAGDGAAANWAAARGLCLQLLPELATQFKGLSRHVLGHVIASLQSGESDASALASLDRDLVLRELRDFLLALSRGQRLVIAVDDIDRVDEPSAALLALLAQRTDEHGILLVASAEPERPAAAGGGAALAALRLLRSVARSIVLPALSESETAELLGAVFGATGHAMPTAAWVHERCQGSPRATMELFQYWLDRRLARREGGCWVLPDGSAALPPTPAALQEARLSALSADALELVLAMRVAEGERLDLCECRQLSGHDDLGRVVSSLSELVVGHVLVAEIDRYRFAHRDFAARVWALVSAPKRKAVHGVLARLLDREGSDGSRRAYHLIEADREREGLELLAGGTARSPALSLAFLERALLAGERLELPPRLLYRFRHMVMAKSLELSDIDVFRRALLPLLGQLESLAGVASFRESRAGSPEARRDEALAAAERSEQAVPENARCCSAAQALREFERLYIDSCWLALQLYQPDLLDVLPALEPLLGFSPRFAALVELVGGARFALSGRVTTAIECYERALQALARMSGAEVEDADDRERELRMAVREHLGSLLAGLGSRAAEPHARILEAQREYRDAAFRVRARLYLSQGNVEEGRKWQRRYDLLRLQRGSQACGTVSDLGFELLAHAFTGDLPAIARTLASLAELTKRHPGWRPAECLGECHSRWLQGDLAGAIDALAPALERDLAGKHPHYAYAAATHVVLLCEQDNAREAVVRGRDYERIFHKVQIGASDRWLRQGLAYALGRAGKHEAAATLVGQVIDLLEGLGVSGLALGSAYEIRAKVAIYAGDLEAYERAAQRCSEAYMETCNPAMIGKLEQLTQEAATLQKQPALAR